MRRVPQYRPGDHFGKYEIIRAIGTGGQAQVYAARDERLDRSVAIKFLHDSLAGDKVALTRFQHEAQLLVKMDHANLPSIHDMDVSPDGVAFIVMELLYGEDLRFHMNRQELALQELLYIIAEATKPLAMAHALQIVHRDVKPENLYICLPNRVPLGKARVRTLDFGGARRRWAKHRLTVEGSVFGTVFYMPPEQIMDEDDIDGRCDIYALGSIMWEALAGYPLFSQGGKNFNPQAIAAAHLSKTPPSICELRPDVPRDVGELIARALAKRPDERFPDMTAFGKIISGILARITKDARGLALPPLAAFEAPPAGAPEQIPARIVVAGAVQFATTTESPDLADLSGEGRLFTERMPVAAVVEPVRDAGAPPPPAERALDHVTTSRGENAGTRDLTASAAASALAAARLVTVPILAAQAAPTLAPEPKLTAGPIEVPAPPASLTAGPTGVPGPPESVLAARAPAALHAQAAPSPQTAPVVEPARRAAVSDGAHVVVHAPKVEPSRSAASARSRGGTMPMRHASEKLEIYLDPDTLGDAALAERHRAPLEATPVTRNPRLAVAAIQAPEPPKLARSTQQAPRTPGDPDAPRGFSARVVLLIVVLAVVGGAGITWLLIALLAGR